MGHGHAPQSVEQTRPHQRRRSDACEHVAVVVCICSCLPLHSCVKRAAILAHDRKSWQPLPMPVLAEPAAEGACRGSKLRPRGHLCSTSSKPPQTSSDNTHTRHHTPEQTPPTTQKHTRPNGTTGTTGSTSTTQRHHQHHQHHRHHTPDVGAPRVSANRSRARPCKGRAR